MALTEKEATFYHEATAAGIPEADVFARIKAGRAKAVNSGKSSETPPYALTEFGGDQRENKAGPYGQDRQNDAQEVVDIVRQGGAERDLADGGTAEQRDYMQGLHREKEGHDAAVDFARFALGGLAGMGASQVARAAGAGGRTAGIVGGAVGGAAPAVTPDAKAPDILMATIMGGALGSAGAPRGKRNVSRTQAGRATNAVERVGGEVGQRRPATGGMFDEPGYKALPEGDPGTMQMAEQARGKISTHLEGRDAANRGELAAAEAGVESKLGDRKLDTAPIREQIAQLRTENANTPAGAPIDPGLERRLAQIDQLLNPPAAWPGGPLTEEPGATFGQLRGLQKSLNAEAQGGMPGTAENRPARLVQGSVRQAVRAAHPDVGPALDKYGAEAGRLADAKNAMYGGEGSVRGDDLMTLRNDETARGRLARYGKEGVAASNSGTTLDELGSQDPTYRHQLDRLAARNAADILSLQLSMPGGAGISQGVARTVGHNLGAVGERFVRPATGIGYDGRGPGAPQLQLAPLIELLLQQESRR